MFYSRPTPALTTGGSSKLLRALQPAFDGHVELGWPAMTKLLFMPFRIVGGILAGTVATKTFERIWRLLYKEQAPDPERRDVSLGKLAAALLLEGAIFRAVRGLFDHGARVAFRRATGSWPGEEPAEPSES
jgi:hypothetical protein